MLAENRGLKPAAVGLMLGLTALVFCNPSALAQNQRPAAPAKPEGGATAQQTEPAKEAAQPAAPATYVGSETCQVCHEDIFKAMQRNPHWTIQTLKRPRWKAEACESCHGPGSVHAESAQASDIRQPAKVRPAEADRTCLACHLNQPTQAGRIHGGHARNQVSCVRCHSIHQEKKREPEMRTNLCTGCHTAVWAQFQRPHAHPVAQGGMSCVDCHNPHGSFLARSVRTVAANEPGCFRCHGDKRGPFTFEHAPVRLEGCQSCHEPHGSANPRLLNRADVRFQCLECHANLANFTGVGDTRLGGVPPAFHDLRSP
ncbi:MAG: DmsE family decaheme c-type cytochrome, partial [Acidobacteria bacterium]|nr:DmsE family decaheme c-type cytochrome [Acidobacteriota bacterium]